MTDKHRRAAAAVALVSKTIRWLSLSLRRLSLRPRPLLRVIETAAKKAGVDGVGIHSLRHFAAEELMLVRGVMVSYQTIRQWCAKFGPEYASCGYPDPSAMTRHSK